jgi:signal transduction histidine kinase
VRELHTLSDAKNIEMVIDQSIASAPSVTADKQRIKQVIYNLIGNAVKFTESGSITISTRTEEDLVYTVVTDTGRGMSAENQQLLFRKFQQAENSLLTRDSTKGTGLGLFISKLIIEQSGGTIGLQTSELGKGSAFSFCLPRTKLAINQVVSESETVLEP